MSEFWIYFILPAHIASHKMRKAIYYLNDIVILLFVMLCCQRHIKVFLYNQSNCVRQRTLS